MATHALVNGQSHRLTPTMVIGQGGEAVIYRLKDGDVLKLYLTPSDPAFNGDRNAQAGAQLRLDEQQRKLPAFPSGLPSAVIAPKALAYDAANGGRIIGYTMPFVAGEVLMSYGDRRFRDQNGVDANMVVDLFRSLREVVTAVHGSGAVLGDFNDLNVVVKNHVQPFVVDADSMQFGSFPCRTFTARFVDPLHCAPDQLLLQRPHSESSDWYAFATMLFQSLLLLSPYYGGVHRPKTGLALRGDARVLHRLTVMSPEVIYPKSAMPLSSLPDELLDYFTSVYEHDKRGDFPLQLLENLRWTTCTACGTQHTRAICPGCAAPGIVKQSITKRGTVTATRLFRTSGRILFAGHQGGEVRYLYHEGGAYRREQDRVVLQGTLDGALRFRISGDTTLIAKGAELAVLHKDGNTESLEVDTVGKLPIFDGNSRHHYWTNQGRLLRNGSLAPITIGAVLPKQTLLWVGEKFGFGFYRAGSLTRGFVFDANNTGINDSVPLPVLRGSLIDATCVFSNHLAWFMLSVQDEGVIRRHCYVISDKATVVASTTATQGDGSWLGQAGIRGRMAMGDHLFAATDSGIVRISTDAGLPVVSTFPDTEPFVSTETQLTPGKGGILAVNAHDITLLQIS